MKSLMTLALLTCAVTALAGTAKIEVQVVDRETMKPMRNLEVMALFGNVPTGIGRPVPVVDKGITDVDGRCRLSGKTDLGNGVGQVEEILVNSPKGYYRGEVKGPVFTRQDANGIWQPDNLVVTAALQKTSFTIPLYVRFVSLFPKDELKGWNFDGTNSVVAYDLVADQMMPPYGEGKVADVILRLQVERPPIPKKWFDLKDKPNPTYFERSWVTEYQEDREKGMYDTYHFTVEFPGEDNGVQEVRKGLFDHYRISRAPDSGYEKSFRETLAYDDRSKGESTIWERYEGRALAFRIRSRRDENGKLVGGYYGKVYDGFKMSHFPGRGLMQIDFEYFLNPHTLDHNLRWNKKDNLCKKPQIYTFFDP